MDLTTYQIEARVTAVFKPEIAILYPPLGLIDEFGEFIDAYYSDSSNDNLIKELGDVLWYYSATCDIIGASVEELIQAAPLNVSSAYIDMLVTIGKIAGIAKKAERDGILKKDKLREQLIHFAGYIKAYAFAMDVKLEVVAEKNISKLRDRQRRNVLFGDGDNR